MSSRDDLRRGLRTLIRSTSEEMAALAESSSGPLASALEAEARARLVELRVDHSGDRARATVEFAFGDDRVSGEAEGSARTSRGSALAAAAAARALASRLPESVAVAVEHVGAREIAGESAIQVAVAVRDGAVEQILVGAAFLRRRTAEETAALAVLNALERRLGALRHLPVIG